MGVARVKLKRAAKAKPLEPATKRGDKKRKAKGDPVGDSLIDWSR
jgi:hypothetical protein